jgi:hypothetical protein
MSEIKKPEIPNLKNDILIMVKNEFLKLNNLKIGDSILWNFRYEELKSQYRKREMARVSFNEESEGILKESEEGFLFVESVNNYSFYTHTWNGRSGRQSKYNYVRAMKKATHFFGTGFIHVQPQQ